MPSRAAERLCTVEDCRQLTRSLERELLAVGERLVRVPPKLMAPQRRASRTRGKSTRSTLREPRLDHPRPGEPAMRELKLLVRSPRRPRRRAPTGAATAALAPPRLDAQLTVPPGALDRPLWLDRVARRLGRAEQTVQVRIARELVGRCRNLTCTIVELDRELQARTEAAAPALLALHGPPAPTRRPQPDSYGRLVTGR